ncbi:MAG: signal recognition particle receptor subunit alpha, partial [Planctomycetota bacterium]
MSGRHLPPRPGGLDRIRVGLRRTRESILGRLAGILTAGDAGTGPWLDQLETALIEADLGPRTAAEIVREVRASAGADAPTAERVREAARRVLKAILTGVRTGDAPGGRPSVILVVGVNGSGKTTTVGKLARRLRDEGKRVVVCAADTFRAGAGEQLRIWARRAGVECAGQRRGADPSAIVFDAAAGAPGGGGGGGGRKEVAGVTDVAVGPAEV